MYTHFNLVGDFIPNSNGEIHLEPIDIKEIWNEYQDDLKQVNEDTVSYIEFGCMWKYCFSHVKIREYKAVTGINYMHTNIYMHTYINTYIYI